MFPMDEELSSLQWFQLQLLTLDKYWAAFTDNCSVTAVGLVVASLVTALATWLLTRDTNERDEFKINSFKTRKEVNFKETVTEFDDSDPSGSSRFEDITHETNMYDNISSKKTSKDGVISKIKQAKHAAISKKIKEELTTEELEEEKRIQAEQLAKIYSLLSESEDEMGKMSYDELKNQMSMYEA